jgi:murein DD-endopeptidase MepM/ murein hydrolase activator NlpD
VVAPVAGTVSQRSNRVGGLSFHLQGDDGTYYYGTHLSAYGAAGWVPVGTVIGYVGDSGNARGTPHLHFEVHPGGEGSAAVNPYPMVALLCDEVAA